VLKRVIGPENGPYIIAAWTQSNGTGRNSDLVTPFKFELSNNPDIPKPVIIVDLDKIRVMQDLTMINSEITNAFDGKNIFEIIFDWESLGRVALADVIKTIYDISLQGIGGTGLSVNKHNSLLKKSAERNMHQFAVSVSGVKNLKPNKSILTDAQMPLVGILQDYLETLIKSSAPDLERLSKKIFKSRKPKYTVVQKAQMNTFFLLSNKTEQSIRPGNIYLARTISNKIHNSSRIPFSKNAFLEKKKILSDITKSSIFKQKISDFKKRAVPILIEVTPECDYVQKKWKVGKLIFGMLYPCQFSDGSETEKYIKNAGRFFQKIPIKYNDSVYYFILHSDYQYTIPLPLIKSVMPIMRAKKELLSDIQHWLSFQFSRPGKTEF
jgi:hypothetical protein